MVRVGVDPRSTAGWEGRLWQSKLLNIKLDTGGRCDQQTDVNDQGERSVIIPTHSKPPIGWTFNVSEA